MRARTPEQWLRGWGDGGTAGPGHGRLPGGPQAPPSLAGHCDLAAAFALTRAFRSLRRAVPASPDGERPPGSAQAARSRCLPGGRICRRKGDCVRVGFRVSPGALGSPAKAGAGQEAGSWAGVTRPVQKAWKFS